MPPFYIPRKPLANKVEGTTPPQMRINPSARIRPTTWADKVRDWAQEYLGGDPNSEMMGLTNPLEVASPLLGATVWHGTGAKPFKKFNWNKIGTGEGAQAYGYGHYLAGEPRTAQEYFEQQGKHIPGGTYFRGKPIKQVVRELEYARGSQKDIEEALLRKIFNEPERTTGRSSVTGYADNAFRFALNDLGNYNPSIGLTPQELLKYYRQDLANELRGRKRQVRQAQNVLSQGDISRDTLRKESNYNPDYMSRMEEILGNTLQKIKDLRLQGKYSKQIVKDISFIPEAREGGILKVDLPDEEIERMIKWDAPQDAQTDAIKDFIERPHPKVRQALTEGKPATYYGYSDITPATMARSLANIRGADLPYGQDIYRAIERIYGSNYGLNYSDAQHMVKAGITGNKYLSGMTRRSQNWRSSNPKDFNYVSFSDEIPKILDYYDWNKLRQSGFDWYDLGR